MIDEDHFIRLIIFPRLESRSLIACTFIVEYFSVGKDDSCRTLGKLFHPNHRVRRVLEKKVINTSESVLDLITLLSNRRKSVHLSWREVFTYFVRKARLNYRLLDDRFCSKVQQYTMCYTYGS